MEGSCWVTQIECRKHMSYIERYKNGCLLNIRYSSHPKNSFNANSTAVSQVLTVRKMPGLLPSALPVHDKLVQTAAKTKSSCLSAQAQGLQKASAMWRALNPTLRAWACWGLGLGYMVPVPA